MAVEVEHDRLHLEVEQARLLLGLAQCYAREIGVAVGMALVDRLAEFLELQFERIEQAGELLAALLAETLGLVVEDALGEVLERLAQAYLGLFEQLQLLRGRVRLRRRARFERCMAAGEVDQLYLRLVAQAPRVGELAREPLHLRLLRGSVRGDLAQVLFGERPFVLVALDARRELLGATCFGVALATDRRDFGIAARAPVRMAANAARGPGGTVRTCR